MCQCLRSDFFNSVGNWGSGAGQIGAGTAVHLCGTISTTLATQGSGSSGNPITIIFESGAELSKAAWGITSSAAIYISGEDYITVDGNNVGVIESTDNGTGLGTQQQAHGIDITNGSTDITIRNLTIQNIYVGNSVDGGVTDPNEYGRAIYADNTSNLTINNNTISHGGKIILYSFRASASNVNIYNNTLSNFIVGVTVGSAGTGVAEVLNGLNIYNNTISPGTNWNGCWQVTTSCDTWHHQDGIHIFAKQNANTQVLNARIYNNYIGDSHSVYTSGTVKSDMTAWIYTEGNPGTIISPWIYNNVMVAASGSGINPTNAFYYLKETTGSKFYNNIIYGNGGAIGIYISSDSSVDMQNNIFYDLSQTVQYYGVATAPVADFNIHYSITTLGFEDELNTSYTTLANWQTILGGCPNSGNECSSSVSQPTLDGSYRPTVSDSVARDLGTDLSAYFTSDKSGTVRPSGSSWDIGAYEYVVPTYTIGGTISGLTGTATLQNNAGDDKSISSGSVFTFDTELSDGASYSVTVSSQPSGQTCVVANGSGAVSSSNVTSIVVTCTTDSTPAPDSSSASSNMGGRRRDVSKLLAQNISVQQNITGFSINSSLLKPVKYLEVSSDVKKLQSFLNSDPDTSLVDTGPGSLNNETEFFGMLTLKAVIKFQEKYAAEILFPLGLTKGTGFVGPATLKKINELTGTF